MACKRQSGFQEVHADWCGTHDRLLLECERNTLSRRVEELEKLPKDIIDVMRVHGHRPEESDYYAALYMMCENALTPPEQPSQEANNLRPSQSETKSADDSVPRTSVGQTAKSNDGVSHGVSAPCEVSSQEAGKCDSCSGRGWVIPNNGLERETCRMCQKPPQEGAP